MYLKRSSLKKNSLEMEEKETAMNPRLKENEK